MRDTDNWVSIMDMVHEYGPDKVDVGKSTIAISRTSGHAMIICLEDS